MHASFLARVACLCALHCSHAVPGPMPVPERQNAKMATLYESAHTAAKVASDAATPELLAFLDDATFRANLTKCCRSVAKLPARELLARYRAELEVACNASHRMSCVACCM